MTVIVGLIGKNSITVAADSRTSFLSSGSTSSSTMNKIHVLKFKNGHALVAQAGHCDLSSGAIDMMESEAANMTIDNANTVSNLAEMAVKKVKEHLRDQNQKIGFDSNDFKTLFSEHSFELLLAHFCDGKPLIHRIFFEDGLSIKHRKQFVAIGCGASLADFMLTGLAVDDMDFGGAVGTCMYVVEKVKKHDVACGGEPTLIALFSDGAVAEPTPKEIACMVDVINKHESNVQKNWVNSIQPMLDAITAELEKASAPK